MRGLFAKVKRQTTQHNKNTYRTMEFNETHNGLMEFKTTEVVLKVIVI